MARNSCCFFRLNADQSEVARGSLPVATSSRQARRWTMPLFKDSNFETYRRSCSFSRRGQCNAAKRPVNSMKAAKKKKIATATIIKDIESDRYLHSTARVPGILIDKHHHHHHHHQQPVVRSLVSPFPAPRQCCLHSKRRLERAAVLLKGNAREFPQTQALQTPERKPATGDRKGD